MTDPAHKDLDNLLGEAAQQDPAVPSDLMARVLIDAAYVQPRVAASGPVGLWASLVDMIGGWPAVGGIAVAGVAGVWIGFAPPAGIDTLTATVLGDTQTVDLFGDDGFSSLSEELDG